MLEERESAALRDYVVASGRLLTSRVGSVEVARAVASVVDAPDTALAELWARVEFIELDKHVAGSAARIGPRVLRSLDAIHLASALTLAGELEGFITYDARLADAARAAGLTVVAPG